MVNIIRSIFFVFYISSIMFKSNKIFFSPLHSFFCDIIKYILSFSSLRAAISNPVRATTQAVCETHDEKNMRLKRPMSPHLTIYQIQLTATLSITHRATGMILAGYAMFLGFGKLLYHLMLVLISFIDCILYKFQHTHIDIFLSQIQF